MMAGALNFTPTSIFRPLSTRKLSNKRVFFVQSSTNSSEIPVASTSVSIKEETSSGSSLSPPPNFKPPKPKPFSVRPDKVLDILGASLALVFRLTTSVLVSGYSASFVPKNEIPSEEYALEFAGFKLKETSKLGPRPEKPIEIYEFESCPFCRKVREIVAFLDLDVLFYPCPKNGPNFRPRAVQMGGKKQFPYMVDPNTGVSMYESDDIIKYLVQKYGDGKVPIMLSLGLLTTLTEGFAMIGRMGKGSSYVPSKLPSKPLEIWAYEVRLWLFCRL
ncbi:uncharacterized protein LOC111366255 [Olea europaea subsp. europaea]|uniref:Uncharacterized protein LOC111366255 n=1 Tax=Olea europaea subsp. europaea TaxID=158383 RepID=A0A8S0R1L5_OLEEU|nr:uncharacterized protein LOC111366255 [Olea europaea subsp. europaea]